MKQNKYFTGEFNLTGIPAINIHELARLWNQNFSLIQWGDEFTIVEHQRNRKIFKSKISDKQAFEIIQILNLLEEKSTVFASGSSWRKKAPSNQ